MWKERSDHMEGDLERSTFAVNFGRRLALAFRCMFKLVDDRNHDEVGDS